MVESGATTAESGFRDGFWGTLGWIYPGLGLSALVGIAFAGPSAIYAWAPWEHLGRMTVGFSAALAVCGGVVALCVGWVAEARRKRTSGSEPSPTVDANGPRAEKNGAEKSGVDATARQSASTEPEAADPTTARLAGLSRRRIVLWVLLGILCCAMGMLGEVARSGTNRVPVGTKTGDAVPAEIWAVAMVVVALAAAGLVVLCLAEDRVRRTTQRDWLRAQLREATPPAKRTRTFYRGMSTPLVSRACALLAAPFISAGFAVLLVGSVEMGGIFEGSTAAFADLRGWGVAAVIVGAVLLVLGVARAARWHRENSDLRDVIAERWPLRPAAPAPRAQPRA